MDQEIEKYINDLVGRCMQAPFVQNYTPEQKSTIQQKLSEHFNGVILDTLIKNASDQQLMEMENLDFQSEESLQKVQMIAASIPNFLFILDERLQKEADTIIASSTLPFEV